MRAEALLSLHGYQVDIRSISEERNRLEMESLGFTFVPTVKLGDRAFAGFPDEVLLRELGLEVERASLNDTLEKLGNTIFVFNVLLEVVPHLPQELWSQQVVEERDRQLGQWVWHIFRFAEEVIEAVEDGHLSREKLLPMAERKYWIQASVFSDFPTIAEYGAGVVQRVRTWSQQLTESALDGTIDTPWGNLTTGGFLDHLHRHSAIHLRQILERVESDLPDFAHVPSDEVMSQIPNFGTLARD